MKQKPISEMTEMEFIESQEYSNQKRKVYFSKSKRKVRNLGEYAHKKAMEFYKNQKTND